MKKRIVIIICFLLLYIGCFFGMKVYEKNVHYNDAMVFLDMGDEYHASVIFEELGDYKDSEIRINEYRYKNAIQLVEQGQYTNAYLMLKSLGDYKDSFDLKLNLLYEYPALQILDLDVGQSFLFGSYEQDNDNSDGKEPIEWILLSKENGNIYAISKYVLDVQQFNSTDRWSASIYTYLNNSFLSGAFSKEERNDITHICLLKKSEIKTEYNPAGFVDMDLSTEYTPYALSKDPTEGSVSGLMWWLEAGCKTAASCTSGGIIADVGTVQGATNYSTYVTNRCGVRPTIWILTNQSDLPYETAYDNSEPIKSTTSSSKSSNSTSTGCNGSVGCREGFHPCHRMSNGYCNQCCKDTN